MQEIRGPRSICGMTDARLDELESWNFDHRRRGMSIVGGEVRALTMAVVGGSRDRRARMPSGMSRERPHPFAVAPLRPAPQGCLRGRGIARDRNRLGRLDLAAGGRQLRARRRLAAPLRVRDVYADSPYQNARPGVGYVGDAACTRCHREIAEAYRSHPMGRSLAPVGGAGTARRPPPLRDSRSSRRACSTRSSAATGACSTRRRAATRREACSPRSRPKSASLSARGRAAPPS